MGLIQTSIKKSVNSLLTYYSNLLNKFLVISECIRKRFQLKIVEKSGYDEWFIREIAGIVETESSIKKNVY